MSSKYAGYMGKVIMVDLSTETVSEYPWNDEQRELYLGGKIMAARILCDHLRNGRIYEEVLTERLFRRKSVFFKKSYNTF